ncbi:hypothetical protein [Phormidium sp. CCY1219]|uniref:hypothetical protein n=1 Tax=Phormidium sp. CCY1219 TaxID=2886104 RepID=UPI002D1F0AE3|nr:hypothetical protein [Phormidium sp. CCY1219]MEB3829356.1 hypothetical protein [Phormidium sp. CCY1219]
MIPDIRDFYRATNPDKALVVANAEDKKYYIDFAAVRGGDTIEKLKKKITFFDLDKPTFALFIGHIGCGKSTELLRLKMELETEGFYVVYFESSEDLELNDVDTVYVLDRPSHQSKFGQYYLGGTEETQGIAARCMAGFQCRSYRGERQNSRCGRCGN